MVLQFALAQLVVLVIFAGGVFACREVLRRIVFRANRIAVTLKGNEGEFAGVLIQKGWREMVLEKCVTVPTKASEAPQDIVGRVRVDRANIAYIQELSNEGVAE